MAVFHRGTKETTLPSSVRHLHGDRERLAHFQNEFRDFAPDCVLAMALPAGNDRTGRLFVDVFRGIARRAVVITSRDVYRAFGRLRRLETGTPDPVPLTETSPLRETLYPYRGTAADPMQQFGTWLEAELASAAAAHPNVGRTFAIHRLNQIHREMNSPIRTAGRAPPYRCRKVRVGALSFWRQCGEPPGNPEKHSCTRRLPSPTP